PDVTDKPRSGTLPTDHDWTLREHPICLSCPDLQPGLHCYRVNLKAGISWASCVRITPGVSNMRRELRDRRILLTGASSGIGRSLAEHLARAGARLALAARSEDKLRQLAESLGGTG